MGLAVRPSPLPGCQGAPLAEGCVGVVQLQTRMNGEINHSEHRVPGHAYVGPSCQVKYVFVVNKLIQFVSSLVMAFLN